MSEDPKLPGGGLRRVGRKDRKQRIDPAGPLFPEDAHEPFDPPAQSAAEPEDDAALIEKFVDQALGSVEEMTLGQMTDFPLSEKPAPEARVYTPPPERFPPALEKPPALPPLTPPSPEVAASPAPAQPGLKTRRVGDWRHNLVALTFMLATLGLCGYYALLWANPYSPLNPFAPPTPFVVVTVTQDPLAAAAFYATQTAEAAPLPAPLPAPVDEAGNAAPTQNPLLTPPFAVRDEILYMPNSNGRGCDWASIAGTVTGLQGEPLNNYGVRIIDAEDPNRLDARVFSGSALTFGQGGFELPLGGVPLERQYTIQLFSPAGAPVSEAYTVITSAQCDQNVAVINFIQLRAM